MQIFVRNLQNRSLALSVEPINTVGAIKEQLMEREGIHPNEQRLIFAGKQLDDRETLMEYGIGRGSTLHLMLRLKGGRPNNVFWVEVHYTLDNGITEIFPLDVSPNESIDKMRREIGLYIGVPDSNLVLRHNGETLEDGDVVRDYKLKERSVVVVEVV